MRVLLVHDYYGSSAPSGENRVFEAERTMLERHGEAVEVYTRHSDEIRLLVAGCWLLVGIRKVLNLIKGAMCTIGNPFAARALAKRIREFKPDVVHFHNQFPLISPLAIRAAHKSGAKVVMTLHNYRTVCAAGVPTREGKVCRECFECGAQRCARPTIVPAVKHRCYRGSLLATVPLAINIWLYRKCWVKWVDRFIVLSEFQKERMIECGFPVEKIEVKGNFVQEVECQVRAGERKNQVLYVGRLSDEKGVKTLIAAWRILQSSHQLPTTNYQLTIVGDGAQRAEYEKLAEGLNIQFLGQKPHEEVMNLMAESKATVLPSECWETFGLTVVEGMMVGTPAIVCDLGALPSIVNATCGRVFEHGNSGSLARAIERLLCRDDLLSVSRFARFEFESKYSERSNFGQLVKIYKEVCGDCQC